MSIPSIGTLALCAATVFNLSAAPTSTPLASAAEQALQNYSISSIATSSGEGDIIHAAIDGENGVVYEYLRDLASGEGKYSLDGGVTWLAVDENAPAEIQQIHEGSFELNTQGEDGTIAYDEEICFLYDSETGTLMESTDGGKTWINSDAEVQTVEDANADLYEVSVTKADTVI